MILFTGTLKTVARQQAWNDVTTVGSIPEKDATKRTYILVIGDLNPAVLTLRSHHRQSRRVRRRTSRS